ncbi:MAG: hypothetical protein H0U21_11445 [Acidimicrobiia bacterium]|nr:hypothetical protein [Acidimicrobiia bacterium]
MSSGRTAYASLGCTNRTGLDRFNTAASVDIDGLPIRLGASETHIATNGLPNGAETVATNTVARVEVGATALDELTITGLRSEARASSQNGDYDAQTEFTFVSATLLVAGVPVPISEAQLRNGVVIPGVAEIELLRGIERSGVAAARADLTAIKITVFADPDPAVVKVGRVYAQINAANPIGLYAGSASVIKATGLGAGVRSGPLAYQPLPCRGTNGNWIHNDIVQAGLPGVVRGYVLSASVRGAPAADSIAANTVGKVAKATLLGGRLVVRNLVVRANVRKFDDGTFVKSTDGTTLGGIFLDGERLNAPEPGETLTITGLARITYLTVDRDRNGLEVFGMRIELLGTGVVVQLARASAYIR